MLPLTTTAAGILNFALNLESLETEFLQRKYVPTLELSSLMMHIDAPSRSKPDSQDGLKIRCLPCLSADALLGMEQDLDTTIGRLRNALSSFAEDPTPISM